MDLSQILLTVTVTTTVAKTPSQTSFAFWFDPLFFNFGIGLLFVAIASKVGSINSFLSGILFFSGCLLGGIAGIIANITPWYDPIFFGVILVAIMVLRGII